MGGTDDRTRVLHVDDDPSVSDIVATFLKREDDRIMVQTATDAAEGLEILSTDNIDCIVSDYDMPGQNGIEFLDAVREDYPDLPFILYTGKGSEKVASEAISAGVTDYLQKGGGTSQYQVLCNRIENAVDQFHTQRELDRSQDLLGHTEQLADIGGWEADVETGEQRWTDGTYALHDVDPDSEFDPTIDAGMEFYHPDDQDEIERLVERCIEQGEPFDIELRLITADDRLRWVQATGEPIREDGDIVTIRGAIQNITELRERERTLTQLVQRTDRLIDTTEKSEAAAVAVEIAGEVLDASLVGVHILSEDGERLEAAAALDEVREEFGVPPAYGRSDDQATSELVWEAFEQGEAMYIEDIHEYGELAEETPARSAVQQPIDDHGVFILSTTEPDAFDETDRNFIGLVAQTLTAVLDRVEREADLRQREHKLERLHESVREIIGCDTSDQIAERIGHAAETVLEYPLTMVRYYDETAEGLVPVATTEQTEVVFESRPTFTPEGESLNWEAYESGSPVVYDHIGEIDQAVDSETPLESLVIIPIGEYGTVSIGATTPEEFGESDVAIARLLVRAAEQTLSRLDREQELIRQRDELDRQNERLDKFASVISHDLRNPLNIAEGRLELASEDCDSEHLEAVKRAHARMATLIEDTMSLARAGESIGDTEPINLPELVDTCWQSVETDEATLVTDTDASIAADMSRLQQLFENLLRNAVEHGGSEVTITVGDLPDGFYVEDNGLGISEDERGNVLDADYSTAEEGTGFGLSIVREIAEAHGWEIGVTDSEAGGARFEITDVELLDG